MYWLLHLLTRPQVHDDFKPLMDVLVKKTWNETILDLQSHPELKHSLIPFLQQVNENFPKEMDKDNGKKAVALYTALCPLYQILNAILRRPQINWTTPEFRLVIRPFISYIPYLLKGLESDCPFHPSSQPLYRCINGDPYKVLTESPILRKDETHTITSFTSTCDNATTNNQNIVNFIGATDLYTVIEIYNCPFGRQIKALSLHPYQDEVLLVPGLSFRVDAIVRTIPRPCPHCHETNLLRCNHCQHPRNVIIIDIKWNFVSFKFDYVPVGISIDETKFININVSSFLTEYPIPPSPKLLPPPILLSLPPSPPNPIQTSLSPPVLGRPITCEVGSPKAVEVLARDYLHDGRRIHITPETIWGITITLKDVKTGTVVNGTGATPEAALQRANFALEANTKGYYQNEYTQQQRSVLLLQEQQQKQQQQYQQQLKEYEDKKLQQEITYAENQRVVEDEFLEKWNEYQETCENIYQKNLTAIEDAKRATLFNHFRQSVKDLSVQIVINILLLGGKVLYDVFTKEALKKNLNTKEKRKYVTDAILEGAKKICFHFIVSGVIQIILIKKIIPKVKIKEPFITVMCSTISDIFINKKLSSLSLQRVAKVLLKHIILAYSSLSIIQSTKFRSSYAIAVTLFLSNWILADLLPKT